MDQERVENCFIFVLGTLDSLCRKGLLIREKNAPKLTDKGMELFDDLKKRFVISDEELRAVMSGIIGPTH